MARDGLDVRDAASGLVNSPPRFVDESTVVDDDKIIVIQGGVAITDVIDWWNT